MTPPFKRVLEGIAAVVFSLDGTLVDSNEQRARAWVETFAEFGHEVEFFLVKPLVGMGPRRLIAQAIGEVPEGELQALEARHSEIFMQKYLPDVYPMDKANELIVALKERGLVVMLATMATHQECLALLQRGDLKEQFQQMTDADQVDRTKPHPEILLASLRGHELEPGACLLIGDTPYDAEAAFEAGMRFVGVETGGWDSTRLTPAALVAPSVGALYRALQGEARGH